MAKKLGGRAPKMKGVDNYKHHATKTSVDYPASMKAQKPGAAGPAKAEASAGKGHAPVPGYSKTNVQTSCDYPAGTGKQKPGGCGPQHKGGY